MSKGPAYYPMGKPKVQPEKIPETPIIEDGRLSVQAQKFCEVYLATGNINRSVRDSGIHVAEGRLLYDVGKELLVLPIIRDHLAMISPSASDDMEVSISRLEIARRMAWRRNDVRLVKDIEVEITKLRGWQVERKLIATGGMKDLEGVGFRELAGILNSAAGKKELARQGLDLTRLLPPQEITDVPF